MAQAGQLTVAQVRELLASTCADELPQVAQALSSDPRPSVQAACAQALRAHARAEVERKRVAALYDFQREFGGPGLLVGVDEVGRGSVAGPLTVCAVCLPDDPQILYLNDSKQLSPARREQVATQVAEVAIAIGIAHIEPALIDEQGMSACLHAAMAQAVTNTGIDPDAVLIDGVPMHVHPRERTCVKGDGRIACIAAASCVAKVTRDAMMVAYDREYPGYHLAQSKGYASPEHIQAIREHGLTPIHRASFCGNFLKD